jgi:hypothetical protein
MSAVDRVVSVARLDLEAEYRLSGTVTEELLNDALEAARAHTAARINEDITESDLEESRIILEGMFNVFVGRDHALVNNEGHVEWLEMKRDEITWDYWERYKHWLIYDQHRPESVVGGSLDPTTDRILGMLEDPTRPGAWDRRGLVAGQVQSGKTSNYVGLINKSLDAGYKLIIVFAGIHDNLRSQTQSRINTGVLGFNSEGNITGTQLNKRVGVGNYDYRKPRINCPTSSAQKGDFNRHLAKGVGALGSDPLIMVVKKNTTILRNLLAWATEMHHEIDPVTGRKVVKDVPMLVIDDEADYASIDTGSLKDRVTGEESDPSATNRLIRELLDSFQKTAYVGYTATPFANIYINPDAAHDTYGRDLFPEHFILTLPETSAYSGASKTFGLIEDEAAGVGQVEPLPTTRIIDDFMAWVPDGHKKEDLPSAPLPASLVEAVESFVLASAIKRFRKVSTRHNSMLVHVTRFVGVQAEVSNQISDLVEALRNEIKYSSPTDMDTRFWPALARLYESDFVSVHDNLLARGELDRAAQVPIDFVDLLVAIMEVARELQVKTINGEAKDALDYEENPEGITVIAVGGDKLSRGLTLEGLTTSYYLRASRMYDTLLQMGRWFGYRPGYLDVCRLYTTQQLTTWYSRITAASERLYKDFELMAALGRTPRDFGLRVQAHPDGLLVTAANKSRRAKNVRASFSGAVSETILFRATESARAANAVALRTLFSSVSSSSSAALQSGKEFYWRSVPASIVLAFLDKYDSHTGAVRALPKAMAEYVRACGNLETPELTTWDVLIATKDSDEEFELDDCTSTGPIERTPDRDVPHDAATFVIGRLLSTGDEILPLVGDVERTSLALSNARQNWENSTRSNKRSDPPVSHSALAERRLRNPSRGYLMIYPLERAAAGLPADAQPYVGFGISFPWSEHSPSVDYKVNEIYWDLEMSQQEDSEDFEDA